MGMSRDTFYRYKSAVEDGGVEALFERTRRKPNLANRVDQATEDAVRYCQVVGGRLCFIGGGWVTPPFLRCRRTIG